jgi:hypothetical protein
MKKRTITLLSSGIETTIDPAQWLQVAGVKDFDATSTAILRVFQKDDIFLVYGMKASGGKKTTEAYELVPAIESVPAFLDKIAEHCGVEALRSRLTL